MEVPEIRDGILERPLVVLGAVLGAGIGGRIHYLVERAVLLSAPPEVMIPGLDPSRGGSTFFGAMAGLLLALWLLRRRLPTGGLPRFADASVFGLAAGIFIARLGCLMEGCCRGTVSTLPWALPSPLFATGGGLASSFAMVGEPHRHPLPLYLGICAIASAWTAMRRRGSRPGHAFVLFAVLFSTGRFLLEFARDRPGAAGVSVAQWESIMIAAAGALVLAAEKAGRGRGSSGRTCHHVTLHGQPDPPALKVDREDRHHDPLVDLHHGGRVAHEAVGQLTHVH